MKIYLFNSETGIYLGEDFADDYPMTRGASMVPYDATTIAPPQAGNGIVPVFDVQKQRWEVRSQCTLKR